MSYELPESTSVLLYEIYLPKKMSYASKLAEILDSFLTSDNVQPIPAVKEELEKTLDENKRQAIIKNLMSIISGYSIYEVDGRSIKENVPFDKRTWVIRFIIHDPDVKSGMQSSFRSLAKKAIYFHITQRLAEETGSEEEIWFIEYNHCRLLRWIKVEP